MIAVEIGLLTPPFGISVFTVHPTPANRAMSVRSLFAGSWPFVGVMLFVLLPICAFSFLTAALV